MLKSLKFLSIPLTAGLFALTVSSAHAEDPRMYQKLRPGTTPPRTSVAPRQAIPSYAPPAPVTSDGETVRSFSYEPGTAAPRMYYYPQRGYYYCQPRNRGLFGGWLFRR